MTNEEMARAAQVLLDMPLFHKLWDDLERQATSACVQAAPTDHEARQAHAAEARAIISFRNKLRGIAQDAAAGRNAPA